MADKPKGNIFFEFIIVILIVALIGTILYPKMVWQKEDAMETVCRTRMEAITFLEFGFINKVYTYSDTLDKVKELVMSDPDAVTFIDSMIVWDNLILNDDLKQMVMAKQFPDDLRNLISATLEAGRPVRNGGKWDGLIYKLIDGFEANIPAEGIAAVIDTNVVWPVLFGERKFGLP